MKFIANHRIELGVGDDVQILHAGQVLPPMDVDELLRLQDLGAITGVPGEVQAPASPEKTAKKAAPAQ